MTDTVARLTAALSDRYRIEREIGAGGMATVYLAHDIKHDRKVAIKVLRPELGAMIGAERFLAEIRTTANLQHPNILPLFDSGAIPAGDPGASEGSLLYYVMPFVDGESLRARLTREKQLPVAEAVRIATEVAGALDYANRQGVIHRDIKPENILLNDGRALVADFGIALATSRAGARMTETGMSLGTPHYMSPEQAMGDRALTGRSDIYALGCVTYEMLVGEPPFIGSTAQAIIARVVTEDPRALIPQRHTIPANVEAAVLTAIEKLPADRFSSAKEFADALGDVGFIQRTPRAMAAASALQSPARAPARLVPLVAATAVLAALAAWFAARQPHRESRFPARLTIPLAGDQLIAPDPRPFDISPDGSVIAFIGSVDGKSQLFLRPLDDFDAHVIPGTEGAHQPFFSPDGKWVGFAANGKLEKIPLTGGAPIVLTSLKDIPFGASWGADGTILYSDRDSLFRVPDQGGTPTSIHLVEHRTDGKAATTANIAAHWPQFLPDREHALIATDTAVAVLTLGTGEVHPIVRGEQGVYLSNGLLLFDEDEGRMRVVPFDAHRLAITGSPVPAFEAFHGPRDAGSQYAVSGSGTLVYVAGGFSRSLVMVDRNGHETPLAVPARGYRFPRFSPDGEQLTVTIDPRPSQVWVIDLRRLSSTPVTTEGHNYHGVWAPDGNALLVGTMTGPAVVNWPQGGQLRPALNASGLRWDFLPSCWDAREGVLGATADSTAMDIVSFHLGDSALTNLTSVPVHGWQPCASPDGRWITYTSDLTGADQVYVRPLGSAGKAVQVSTNGGQDPVWAADGKSLYYRRGGHIMVAEVDTRAAFEVIGAAREYLTGTWDFSQQGNWDVARDGRFVFVRGDPASTGRLLVVLNWFDELKRKGTT